MKILNHKLMLDSEQACSFQASPNVSKNRTLKPEYIIIHYTSGVSASSSINWLCNPNAKASAHIVIGRDGQITQLAPFNRVTWHAGISRWNQIQNLNGHSIGIELEGTDDLAYTDLQYERLGRVVAALLTTYPRLDAGRMVGHCDIAPARKTDPGAAFDWQRLRAMISAARTYQEL